MKHFYKKLMLLALALSASISISAYDFEVDGIYYNITSSTEKTVEVTYKSYSGSLNYTSGMSGDIIIPENVTYNSVTYTVTGIGNYAFESSSLTSIVIPLSVTYIGRGALSDCIGLTTITIPEGITSIAGGAFSRCANLTSVIWNVAMLNNSEGSPLSGLELKEITFGNKVKSIPSSICHQMSSLTSVIISEGVNNIGNYAFYGCYGLKSVVIPSSVITIENSAFNRCYNLSDVTLQSGLAYIGDFAFYSCNIENLNIPSSVTTIGEYNQEIKGETNVEIIPVSA